MLSMDLTKRLAVDLLAQVTSVIKMLVCRELRWKTVKINIFLFQVRNPDSIPSRVSGVEEGEEDVETDRQVPRFLTLYLDWNPD